MRGRVSLRHVESIIVLCLIGCFAPDSRAGAMDRCEQPVGSLVSVQGTVEVRQEPDGGWRLAFLNELLCEGTVLRVGDLESRRGDGD